MIIIHKVDNFFGELFPRYKSSGYDEDILLEELSGYYTYKVFRPTVDIIEGFVTINIDFQRIENEVEEYKAVVRLCEQGQLGKAKSWALTDTVVLKELNLPFSAEYEMAKGMAKGE